VSAHLWGIEARFDWGKAVLWSGWDRRWNGPDGELLPILFRTRSAARRWIGADLRGRATVVRVQVRKASE